MPNPVRARLHDEIRRVDREREVEPGKSWLLMFWPRVAVAAALATILVIGPVMWWRASSLGRGGAMVASRQAETSAESKQAPADVLFAEGPAAANANAPNVTLADNTRAKLAPEQTAASAAEYVDQSKTVAQSDTTPAVSSQMMKGFISKDEKQAETQHFASTRQPVAPAAPASVAGEAPAARSRARAIETGAASATRFAQQQGAQAFRNNVQTSQTANLLNTFQVQQDGSEIRVVDSDGSTYTGKVEPVVQISAQPLGKGKQAYEAQAREDSKETLKARFSTRGYNVSLKRTVVFEGDYLTPAAQQLRAEKKADKPTEQEAEARIVGTAHVHGKQSVQVDAIAVQPAATEKSER